jgi:hypothetical protein
MKNFIFILLLCTNFLSAQQNTTKIRALNQEKLEKAEQGVNYHQEQKRKLFEQETKKIGYNDVLEENKIKADDIPKKKKSNFNIDWSGLKYVGGFILVIIAALLIYFFVKNATWTNDKKIDDLHSMLAEVENNLPEADVETPLDRAIKEKKFKVATRLYYLLLIQKLAEKNHIKWNKAKTNREYANELKGVHFLEHFRQVTFVYEKVWFGKEVLTQQDFENAQPLFDNLIQKIV